MAFTNFVCWDMDRVFEVMNTNAELAEREVFLAIHSEYPLTITNPGVGELASAARRFQNPREFLREFLSPDRRHMQVAALGESGSGKSHFIKWLSLNIPHDEDKYVISVPRAGISLRGVIDLIISVLPDEKAHTYRDQMDKAGFQTAAPSDLQDRLLSEIALAIQTDDISGEGDQGIEKELLESLPLLFRETSLSDHHKESGGLVEQLVKQVLSASTEYNPVQERRMYEVSDLPLTAVQPKDMGAPTRGLIRTLLPNVPLQELAVTIINRNVDRAIPQMMNFTAGQLQQLFREVRQYLRSQNKELILLIEDLSLLQGLDRALLDALIDEGTEGNGLCSLRWAAAVNTGYYVSLPDTVKTRMASVIDMDMSKDYDDTIVDDNMLVRFASRYMNAIRVPKHDLLAWSEETEEERGDPPNPCYNCDFKTTCHEAFGAEQGIGLYPLNRQAITNMLKRIDPNFDRRFTPRVLVKDVLTEIFSPYARELTSDQFPSSTLLDQMGGPKLAPLKIEELRQKVSSRPDSHIALAELWGSVEGSTVDLPDDLYTAFGLSKPEGIAEIVVDQTKSDLDPKDPAPNKPDAQGDPRIAAIRQWGNGNPMLDNIASSIRPLVYGAILEKINWDNEGLIQGEFASSTSHFRGGEVSFEGQQTQHSTRPVSIRIPLSETIEDRQQSAIALEGLYLFSRHGNWDFPDGWTYYASLSNRLDEWSAHIINKLQSLPVSQKEWNAAGSAIELLAIGAAMAGRPTSSTANMTEVLNSLFEEWPAEIASQSRKWTFLYESIRKDQERLRNMALSRATGSKGGVRGAFIDPLKIMAPLRSIRRDWELKCHPPDGSSTHRGYYGPMATLYAKVSEGLPDAVSDEWHRRTDWVDEWRKNVPEETTRKTLVDGANALLEIRERSGIPVSTRNRDAAHEAISELEKVQLDDALKAAKDLRESGPKRQLDTLGRERGSNAMNAATAFLPAMLDLLDDLEAALADLNANRDQGDDEIKELQSNIRGSLAQLSEDLGVLGGIDAESN
jgi:hypothetical protein